MNELLNQVLTQLSSWPQWQRSQRIVLAISGGVDSMVLLHLMLQVNQQLPQDDKKIITVAHFNHRLRRESKADGDLIKKYIADFDGVYFFGEWAAPAETNVEASARDARYRFFADVVAGTDSDTLMTAHHLNDLGETVIMRLMRGTSLKGLRGIRPNTRRVLQTSQKQYVTVRLLRPLVRVLKEELYEYAKQYQIPYIEDQTNFDSIYLRNRIRQNMIPLFEKENPQFLYNLIALTEQLEASYDAHYEQYLLIEPEFLMPLRNNQWLIYVPRLRQLSDDLLEIYLLILFEERLVHHIPNYKKVAIKQLEHLIKRTDSPNMFIDIANNWRASRSYDYIRIEQMNSDGQPEPIDEPITINQINKWYKLNQNEMIGVFDTNYAATIFKQAIKFEYPLSLTEEESSQFNITIRHRIPGDVLKLKRPDGSSYHKKVSRIMIDQKIPKAQREKYWVVENEQGSVLCMLPHLAKDKIFTESDKKATHYIYYQNKVHL